MLRVYTIIRNSRVILQLLIKQYYKLSIEQILRLEIGEDNEVQVLSVAHWGCPLSNQSSKTLENANESVFHIWQL